LSLIRYKKIYTVLLIIIILIIILIFDFLISNFLNYSSKKIYFHEKNGFYKLNNNIHSYEVFGSRIYNVLTDEFGYRTSVNKNRKKNKYDVIFLGDSAIYGMDQYEDSIVSFFERKTNLRSINAGVPSYSPTTYLHVYSESLKKNILSEKHIIILGLDISDVQDEAGRWMSLEDSYTYDYKLNFQDKINSKNPSVITSVIAEKKIDNSLLFKNYIVTNFRFTTMLYRSIRFNLFNYNYTNAIFDTSRSAFTWKNWNELDLNYEWEGDNLTRGYKPLGIDVALKKIQSKIENISKLAKDNNAELYLLVYPWPAQIIYEESVFSWIEYVNRVCSLSKCDGVINTIDIFKKFSQTHSDWYKDLYINGDIHFNKIGNEMISEAIIHYLYNK
jgi:hypothetical protein